MANEAVLTQSSDIKVDEARRSVYFKDGTQAAFHNVTMFNPSGTFLRLICDEGYILINESNITYMKIKANERVK